jgi:hypothetical protein
VTLAWVIARAAAVVTILIGAFALLPAASTLDTTALEIPDVVWDPLVAVLHLNRLLPIATLLTLAGIAIAIQVGLAGWWLTSWLLRHLTGGS